MMYDDDPCGWENDVGYGKLLHYGLDIPIQAQRIIYQCDYLVVTAIFETTFVDLSIQSTKSSFLRSILKEKQWASFR